MKKKAFIPVSALIGVMLLTLVATMTLFVAEPDVAHAQGLSADATLTGLTVVGGPSGNTVVQMAPGFNAETENYTVRIGFNDSGVRVTPIAAEQDEDDADMSSIVKVNGKTVPPGDMEEISLARRAGMTTNITIHVTAPLRSVTKTYTVKVYRERQTLSNNADLASLRVSGANLSPRFSSGTTSYKARVQADMVTLSQSLSDAGGGASAAITAFNVSDDGTDGSNITNTNVDEMDVTLGIEASTTRIKVTVTPESGAGNEKIHMIDVYHVRANRETNANLATLSLAAFPGGGARVGDPLDLDIMHDDENGTTTDYKERMDTATTHATVSATVADPGGATFVISPSDARPGAELADAGHQVALRAGAETTITVRVTAEDPARRQTYTVKVYRERATKSEDNNLTSLRLSAGTLTPTFSRGRDPQTYTAQVAADVDKVTVSYTASDTAGGSTVVVTSDEADNVTNNEVDLLEAGMQTDITVTVTAENGTAKPYMITVYRLRTLPSADASLATDNGLSVNQGMLDPTYAPGTKMYDVNVPHNISAITVTAIPAAAINGATSAITPNGGSNVALAAGAKTAITITVTAEDGATTDAYTVNVYRQRATPSDDATLSDLSLSAGTLSPDFMSDTIEYKARVANAVDKVTVSHTLNDNAGGASVMVATSSDDTCDTTDSSDGDVSLNAGENTYICVTSTAEDAAATKSYLITVYRLRANANTDVSLQVFTIAEATGTININDGTTNNPEGTLDLLLEDNEDPDVAYRVRQVTVDTTADIGAIVTITPTDADTGEPGHQVDLTAGAETAITVRVMPEDPAAQSKTYTSNVYRKNVPGSESDDATLSSLMLSGVVLTPEFASGTMDYTGAVPYSTMMTTVSPMANHLGAQSSIAIMPDDDNDEIVDLNIGENTITITVTPEDGTATEEYTITVTRAEEISSGATLQSLSLSGLTLDPVFDSATTMYTAEAAEALETTMVEAMATYVAATVEGDGEVSLTVGENTVEVMVTAEDDTTTMTYTITVTILSSDATLDSLTLSDITLEPVFDSATTAYTATVDATVQATTVSATATDPSATIMGDGEMPLTVGENTVEVMVTAEDGTTMMTYTVTVTVLSSDATLASLTLSDITLEPVFDSATTAYTATVDATVQATTVSATATDPSATIEGAGEMPLMVGANTVEVMVTAEDDTTTMTYTITVTVLSSDATLASLTLSDIMLSPDFDSATTAYTATVDATVQATTVSATATDPSATIMGDGEMPLTVGENTVEVMVTAEDGTTMMTYTVTVTVLSSDATLASLTLSDITLEPVFDSATTAYTATVDATVQATTVSATATDPSATIEGAGEMPLMVGANTVEVMVTAEDDTTTMTYTITVTVLSSDATLASLTLSDIMLSPDFDSATTAYTATVDATVQATTVSATATDPSATIMGDGEMPLTVGENTVEVMVTAEDGTTMMTYTVTVTVLSSDATLASLTLSDITLEPVFDSATTAYTATVDATVQATTVSATATHSGATIEGAGEMPLMVGANTVEVMVTAEDDTTTMTYTITVTVLSSDATLASLTLSDIMLSPDFDSATTAYTATVDATVQATTVSATATDPSATIMGDGEMPLTVGENTVEVMVTAEDGTTMMTYTVTVTVLSSDATLSSLMLMDGMGMDVTLVAGVAAHWNTLDCPAMNDRVGADDELDDMTSPYCRMYDGLDDAAKMVVDAKYAENPIEGFMSDIDMYYASVASDVEMIKVMATAMDSDAMVSVMYGADDMMAMMDDDGYYSVSVMEGENTVNVMVTAEDDTTTMTYTVTVTVLMETLLDIYDTNDNNRIDKSEAVAAIRDYIADQITKADVVEVIRLYISG